MAFWQWLKIANSNATADPTINWAEGQSPSSLNDSGRTMMARMAEWRDDVSGTLVTAGTTTAYTVTSNQGFTSLANMNNAMISFVPNAANTGGGGTPVTLNVDGLGAKPIRTAPGVDIQSGLLIAGTSYRVTYNNSDGAFYLHNMPNPYGIPIGAMIPFTGSSAPNSCYAFPAGQQISQSVFATLYALYGANRYGVDAGGNFFLPDLRGRAPFGLGNMGGTDAGRITLAGGNFDGTIIGNAGGLQNHTLLQAELPNVNFTNSGITLHDPTHQHGINVASTPAAGSIGVEGSTLSFTGSTNAASTGVTVQTQGSAASGGSGTPFTVMPPAMVLPFILRVI